MRREIFTEEHELFRSQFRRFVYAGTNEIMKVIIARRLGLEG